MISKKKTFFAGITFVIAFIIWTFLVLIIDVKSIGPNNSSVGFAWINGYFHNKIGVNMTLYVITDWLGFVPIIIAFSFAILGLLEWIKRKSLLKVDYSILILGIFYIVVIGIYVLFEMIVINYRPILINGYLEASYPSSTTMLTICVMPTALIQYKYRIKNKILRRVIIHIIAIFTVFMVIGRLISGVHWITDIIGGAIVSTGLVLIYCSICKLYNSQQKKTDK